mgnify:CR=1 FL=1
MALFSCSFRELPAPVGAELRPIVGIGTIPRTTRPRRGGTPYVVVVLSSDLELPAPVGAEPRQIDSLQ